MVICIIVVVVVNGVWRPLVMGTASWFYMCYDYELVVYMSFMFTCE